MGTAYKWKMPLYNVDAQTAGDYLKHLEDRDGEVIPSVMVEEARGEKSILHPCFEWDNDKAAENYRIQQAKGVIRNIAVVYEREEKAESVTVRAFVHTRENEICEPKYIHIETVLSNELYRKQLLEQATRELNEFRKKYKELVELTEIFRSIDGVLDRKNLAEGM